MKRLFPLRLILNTNRKKLLFLEPIDQICNTNVEDIITPINVEVLKHYLEISNYNKEETQFLVNSFTEGFDMHYHGPENRRDTSNNLPLKVGSIEEIWEKMINEVKLGRYAGPFIKVPFDNFAQSPIRLIPKAGNKGKTRLIFHLSYDFKAGEKSINHFTPSKLCKIKYHDVDHAVTNSFKCREKYTPIQVKQESDHSPEVIIYYSKTDLQSAYRIMPLNPKCLRWFTMMAIDPETKQKFFFMDKCLPFGASISCSHFQRFSNALKHIVEFVTGEQVSITNYLDDFLFIVPSQQKCNSLVRSFLQVCEKINLPVVTKKTELITSQIVFLGVMLHGQHFRIIVPQEK